MADEDDRKLVVAARKGDTEAFGLLAERHAGPIFNLALRVVGERDDAMDVTQATFVKAWNGLDRFDAGRPFFSWVYRIALNESINWKKRSARNLRLPEGVEVPSPANGPEEALDRRRTGARVRAALAGLDPSDRALITLRHFEEMDYDSMAEALDITAPLVKSRLFTARQRLRRLLATPEPAR